MFEFYLAFEKLVEKWQAQTNLSLTQIADGTKSSIARTVDAISTALSQEFDANENITQAEAKAALSNLKERLQHQILVREQKLKKDREMALRVHDVTMEKVRISLAQKDYRTAYRTLVYLLGIHERNLPYEVTINLCGDCIRYGSRSGATIQELGSWLKKAVEAAVSSGLPEAVEDALDFLDTYRDIFTSQPNGLGEKIVNNAFASLSLPVADITALTR